MRNGWIFHSYVNVYQRVIQPDCKCSTDSMSCLTFVLGIVSGATLTKNHGISNAMRMFACEFT